MIILALFMFPVKNDKESGQHSAQMGKMGYVIGCVVAQSKNKLQNDVTNNEPFGLNGERDGYDEQLVVGECHSVTQQDSVYGSRCTYRKEGVHVYSESLDEFRSDIISYTCQGYLILSKLEQFLGESGSDTANEVEQQETIGTPLHLHDTAKHPDGKHVEEQMGESFMKELVCYELPDMKIRCKEKMQSAQLVQVYSIFVKCHRTHQTQYVDDEQIFCYRW